MRRSMRSVCRWGLAVAAQVMQRGLSSVCGWSLAVLGTVHAFLVVIVAVVAAVSAVSAVSAAATRQSSKLSCRRRPISQ